MMYTYWQHEKSGDIYAVRTNIAGEAEGVAGPLRADEATFENYGMFDYDTEDVAWINRQPMRHYEPRPY